MSASKVSADDRKTVAPVLIVAREGGYALDAGTKRDAGSTVSGWPAHGLPHQLWRLQPTGFRDEFAIVSILNGFALGVTLDGVEHPLMKRLVAPAEPWQRWTVSPAPDGICCTISSVHTRRYLSLHGGPLPIEPWFEDTSDLAYSSWLVLQTVAARK